MMKSFYLLDNVLLKNLNENRVFLEFNQILEKSSSITMVCQLMDIILILLKCSKIECNG